MDQQQMLERCPQAILVGPAQLPDFQLLFTIYSPKRKCGCADVVENKGSNVYGLLFKLTDEEAERMDAFEGHPIHYRRLPVTVNCNQSTVQAFTYEVVTKEQGLAPSAHYLGLIRTAAAKFEFPNEYQEYLAKVLAQPNEI